MNRHQPKTVVPGAYRVIDGKGAHIWHMPEPDHYERHFKDAGSRRLAEAEIIRKTGTNMDLSVMKPKHLKLLMNPKQLERYTIAVPIYRGVDSRIANHIRSQNRRSERIASSDKSALGFIKGLVSG